MINRPEDQGAAEADDHRGVNGEYPSKEQLDKALVQTLQLIGAVALFGVVMIVIILAGYQPAPEFHG